MEQFKHNYEVIYTLSTMDLKLRYQNSKLGFLWSFLRPFMQFVTYYIVFGVILRYSDSADYPLRMFLGVLLWTFFTEGTSMGLSSYLGKKSIITKIKVKKELMPISAYMTATIGYFLNMLIFLAMYIVFKRDISFMFHLTNWIKFIGFFLGLSLFTLAMNIILANVNAIFRDIQTIWEIILTYGCFLTPIMYTLPIPEKFMTLYIFVNPLVMPIESIRTIFFETEVFLWRTPNYLIAYIGSIIFWMLMAAFVDKKLKGKVGDYL